MKLINKKGVVIDGLEPVLGKLGIYRINYVLNGGKFEKLPVKLYTYGEGVATLPKPIRGGLFRYSFGGWFLDKNFTQKIDSISKEQQGDITL